MNLLLFLFLALSCSQYQVVEAKYQRREWKHWTDDDGNCLNTRNEILKHRSIESIIYNKKGCKVVSGSWNDYYFPETHSIAKSIDIDHLVPLKNAYISGGADWPKELKEKFANDPENLVITNRSYNRKKGSKGIDKWLPVNRDYACKYIRDWMRIKNKYNLIIFESEKQTKC